MCLCCFSKSEVLAVQDHTSSLVFFILELSCWETFSELRKTHHSLFFSTVCSTSNCRHAVTLLENAEPWLEICSTIHGIILPQPHSASFSTMSVFLCSSRILPLSLLFYTELAILFCHFHLFCNCRISLSSFQLRITEISRFVVNWPPFLSLPFSPCFSLQPSRFF